MNSRIRILLAGAACFAGCALARAQAPGPSVVAEDQMMGPAPSPAYVWMAGHWNSDAGQWKWIAGHWDLPPSRSSMWVPGHWIQKGDGWVWRNGAWNVAEAAQSPSAPPQPPMANVAPGQAVPMPSTPAPGVEGQYAPGQYAPGQYAPGQVPVMDQPPATTDYPPVVYDAGAAYPGYYPGYYYAGDPWAWGVFPGLALGFGWWGGWGYGHGYYGHGYYGHGNWGHGNWGHGGSGGHVSGSFHGHKDRPG